MYFAKKKKKNEEEALFLKPFVGTCLYKRRVPIETCLFPQEKNIYIIKQKNL
jgi:hypothetical protein